MPNLRGKTWTRTTPADVGDAQHWEDHLISNEDANKIHQINDNDISLLHQLDIATINKAKTAVQTVENVGSDTSGNVNVYPSGGQTGQVLTKTGEGRHALAWLDPHSSGHYVKDQSGQTMTQRRVIQFKNAAVSDDPSDEWTIVDCHGEKGDPGEDGKDAYTYAVEGGYPGTEEDFTEDLANIGTYAEDAQEAAEDAENAVEEIRNILDIPTFYVDFTTGNLIFNNDLKYLFSINQSTGNLEWEVI